MKSVVRRPCNRVQVWVYNNNSCGYCSQCGFIIKSHAHRTDVCNEKQETLISDLGLCLECGWYEDFHKKTPLYPINNSTCVKHVVNLQGKTNNVVANNVEAKVDELQSVFYLFTIEEFSMSYDEYVERFGLTPPIKSDKVNFFSYVVRGSAFAITKDKVITSFTNICDNAADSYVHSEVYIANKATKCFEIMEFFPHPNETLYHCSGQSYDLDNGYAIYKVDGICLEKHTTVFSSIPTVIEASNAPLQPLSVCKQNDLPKQHELVDFNYPAIGGFESSKLVKYCIIKTRNHSVLSFDHSEQLTKGSTIVSTFAPPRGSLGSPMMFNGKVVGLLLMSRDENIVSTDEFRKPEVISLSLVLCKCPKVMVAVEEDC